MTNYGEQQATTSKAPNRWEQKKQNKRDKAQKKREQKKEVKYNFTDYLKRRAEGQKPPRYDYTYE